jgi:hypothetical protein
MASLFLSSLFCGPTNTTCFWGRGFTTFVGLDNGLFRDRAVIYEKLYLYQDVARLTALPIFICHRCDT